MEQRLTCDTSPAAGTARGGAKGQANGSGGGGGAGGMSRLQQHRPMRLHGASSAAVPKSPTDALLSPTTEALRRRRSGRDDDAKDALKGGPPFSPSAFDLGAITDIRRSVTPHAPPSVPSLPIILGSSSSHRRAIVRALEWQDVRFMSADIDEKAIRDPDHFAMPRIIAEAKADAIIGMLREEADQAGTELQPALLITADQITLYFNQVREKPENEDQAREFLASYSKSEVQTVSAVVVTHLGTGRRSSEVDVATVCWRDIDNDCINRVIQRGTIFSCAGGFAIEDEDLAPCVHTIHGTVDSIWGLPVDVMESCMRDVLSEEELAEPGAAAATAMAALDRESESAADGK